MILCKDVTKNIKAFSRPPPKTIAEYVSHCTAIALIAGYQLNSKHEYAHVQKGPYIYRHECIHCNRKYEWWRK